MKQNPLNMMPNNEWEWLQAPGKPLRSKGLPGIDFGYDHKMTTGIFGSEDQGMQ